MLANPGGIEIPDDLGEAGIAGPDDILNQSQGEMRRWWGSNGGAGSFSKYG